MKRLRLIKPWQLQAVRQRLSNERGETAELVQEIACRGPEAEWEEAYSGRCADEDPRFSSFSDERCSHRRQAPGANTIFVFFNNATIR